MNDNERRFPRTVGAKAARKRRARERRESVWFGLGMFGLVGWSVGVPTLAGIAVGVWLDHRFPGLGISWTLTGLFVGVVVGCTLAWHWVRQEAPRELDDTGTDPRADDRGC